MAGGEEGTRSPQREPRQRGATLEKGDVERSRGGRSPQQVGRPSALGVPCSEKADLESLGIQRSQETCPRSHSSDLSPGGVAPGSQPPLALLS